MKKSLRPSDIFKAPAPRLFSIDAERPFLADLAAVLRTSIEAEGTALEEALIFLPTRRAVRALNAGFVETALNAGASLLPRIRAIGDVDEDEFEIFGGEVGDEMDLPPALSANERRLTLAKLVAAGDRAFEGRERWASALAAADELGKLLDSFYTEEILPGALSEVVPDALAEHWRRSLDFLSIVTNVWPQHLKEIGRMDPADRRVKLIDAQRRRWEQRPPGGPVVIAGTTGSTPAVARLMRHVAALPLGCVVLPGLDLESDETFWDAIDAPHPQSGLKHLLDALDVGRDAVRPWPGTPVSDRAARRDLIAVALRPANASDSWRDWMLAAREDDRPVARALEGIELVEADNEEREADAIVLKMRGALEVPNKTISLITPNRDLARRVARKLRRWNITVDDSAGLPFAESPCGVYLRLVARALADISDAVALVSVLRHPLFGGGLSDATRQCAAGAMDDALRGLRPEAGIAGVRKKISESACAEAAEPILGEIERALAQWPDRSASFVEQFDAHLRIAEQWAANDAISGADRLWRGEDGEVGAAGLGKIASDAAAVIDAPAADYPHIFDQLIAPFVVRRRAPAHPRIAILGPLEARLQRSDLVILGGLNEGIWPRDAAIDPFLSRPMRESIGLPSPEQRIGLAAHDFSQAAGAPEVMLTRARMGAGKPATPSRWIVRLKNILTGAKALPQVDATHYYDILAQRLDEAETVRPAPAPTPRPPLEARPRLFHVGRVEKLLRDPYAVYARYILRLKKLEGHNQPLDVRHIGILFHEILREYAAAKAPPDHEGRVAALTELFERLAPAHGVTSDHLPFWAARARAAFDWIADWDAERRRIAAPMVLEGEGAWNFDIDGRAFTLAARADRIDQLENGAAFLIDYKTGTPPTQKQAQKFSPQLPLTGVILKRGGFDALGAASVAGFEYIRILGRKNRKDDTTGATGEDCAKMIAEAELGLFELLRHFNNPETAYPSQPRPQYRDDYGDYDHLARRRERGADGGDP